MKLTHNQFLRQLQGARLCDRNRWGQLDQEGALWRMFAFDDEGATWLDAHGRKMQGAIEMCDRQLHFTLRRRNERDWGAEVKSSPGYSETDGWIVH